MTHIDVKDVEKQLQKLIQLVSQGEEIIIHRDNQPIARLSPINGSKFMRQFGSAKGKIEIAEDFDAPLNDFNDYTLLAT